LYRYYNVDHVYNVVHDIVILIVTIAMS